MDCPVIVFIFLQRVFGAVYEFKVCVITLYQFSFASEIGESWSLC